MTNELILQFQTGTNILTCESFEGVPSIRPCYLVIVYTESLNAAQNALLLKQQLVASLLSLGSSVKQKNPPCNSDARPFLECRALSNPDCKKLLIIVADGTNPNIQINDLSQWQENVLSIFPHGAHMNLPDPFNVYNVFFWSSNIEEVIPNIYGAIGISSEDFKIFISYKRNDTERLAEQLFDNLHHNGFDVFLDRFSIAPGINFQNRLYQELSDKAMVLVLESENLNKSPWVQLEIAFAKKYRLGYVSLHLPNCPKLIEIDDSNRISIDQKFLDSNFTYPYLQTTPLKNILNEIKHRHSNALLRKRLYLQYNMFLSLAMNGANPTLDSNGFIEYQNNRTSTHYKLWLTPRPPDIKDYHYTDIKNSNGNRIIIGPEFQESHREILIQWLSSKSQIHFFNESEIINVADKMVNGTI